MKGMGRPAAWQNRSHSYFCNFGRAVCLVPQSEPPVLPWAGGILASALFLLLFRHRVGTPEGKMVRDRVVPARRPGVAAQKPPNGKQPAPERAEAVNRSNSVPRAGWDVSAVRLRICGDKLLIKPDQEFKQAFHHGARTRTGVFSSRGGPPASCS